MKNPRKIDDVINDVTNLDGIDWKYYTLEKDDTSYSSTVKPLTVLCGGQ